METTTPDAEALFGPETLVDPFPLYDRLREHTPLATGPHGDAWVLMRHDDVYGALSDHQTFSSSHPGADAVITGTPMVFDDEPRHGRFRKVVSRAFTPRRVAEAEPAVRAQADALLDLLADDGPVDVMDSFCAALPIYVIADMLGVPRGDRPRFRRWSQDRSYVVGRDGLADETDETHQAARAGSQALDRYFERVVAERRRRPGDDLVSALVAAEWDGRRLEEWEVLGVCALLLTAGNVTTANLIGNMLAIFADRPELYARVRDDRSLVEPVVEETLRYESPVQRFLRRTTRDVDVSGVVIPGGARVLVYYGAANRDPDAFPDPHSFRLDRNLRSHLAFSHGIHFCLGAPLARLEARVALEAVLDRYDGIEPAPGARRQDAEGTHLGWSRLPLVFRGAP